MNRKYIPLLILLLAAAISPGALVAQIDLGSPNQQTNPARPAPDSTSIPGDSAQDMQDKAFLRKAAEGGMAEVQLGKLATEMASADDVKAFAQKMVDDHMQLNNTMAPIAQSRGVAPPKKMSKANQAESDKLSTLSGDAFDKEYIAYMVKEHHADLREFRIEATTTTDPELKAAVDKGAQVIHHHMVIVDKLAQDKGIATPGRGNKPSGMSIK
jgi:putative membrane protein